MSNDVPKRKCFVALFDILGFTEIVKHNKLEDVWRTYKDFKSPSLEVSNNLQTLYAREVINVETFSDTFLVYTSDHRNLESDDIDKNFDAMLCVCDVIYFHAFNHGLSIRGAITAGELIVEEGFRIGKPIVDAYNMEKDQIWIGCWIGEEAIKLVSRKRLERQINGKIILRYNIPSKNKGDIDGYVYNWVQTLTVKDYEYRYGWLEESSSHDEGVKKKIQNTKDFIKYVHTLRKK